MHGPEHGCPKCVIDGGFTLAVLPILRRNVDPAVTDQVDDLRIATQALVDLLRFVAHDEPVRVPPDYDGCHKATTIMAWVTGEEMILGVSIAETLRGWTNETWAQIASIVGGADAGGRHTH